MQFMPRWERKICSDHINWRVNCSLNSLTLRSSGINLFGRSNYHLRKWRIPLSSRSFSRLVKFESRFELLFNHMVFCQFTPIWRIVGIILSESFERKKQKKVKKIFQNCGSQMQHSSKCIAKLWSQQCAGDETIAVSFIYFLCFSFVAFVLRRMTQCFIQL